MGTAQNSSFEESIAIKPSITLIDFSDLSFSQIDYTPKFSDLKYTQDLKTRTENFQMDISGSEIVREGFMVFDSKRLKRSFFRDFNSSYRRSQLERLLPRLPDISDFTPCF